MTDIWIFESDSHPVEVRREGEIVWLSQGQMAESFGTSPDNISVGYRVSSARATQFRIWATRVLPQHLVDGYTLNQRRLQERGIEFEPAVSLLARTLLRAIPDASAGLAAADRGGC